MHFPPTLELNAVKTERSILFLLYHSVGTLIRAKRLNRPDHSLISASSSTDQTPIKCPKNWSETDQFIGLISAWSDIFARNILNLFEHASLHIILAYHAGTTLKKVVRSRAWYRLTQSSDQWRPGGRPMWTEQMMQLALLCSRRSTTISICRRPCRAETWDLSLAGSLGNSVPGAHLRPGRRPGQRLAACAATPHSGPKCDSSRTKVEKLTPMKPIF